MMRFIDTAFLIKSFPIPNFVSFPSTIKSLLPSQMRLSSQK